jgi:hypothetical protein
MATNALYSPWARVHDLYRVSTESSSLSYQFFVVERENGLVIVPAAGQMESLLCLFCLCICRVDFVDELYGRTLCVNGGAEAVLVAVVKEPREAADGSRKEVRAPA